MIKLTSLVKNCKNLDTTRKVSVQITAIDANEEQIGKTVVTPVKESASPIFDSSLRMYAFRSFIHFYLYKYRTVSSKLCGVLVQVYERHKMFEGIFVFPRDL